LDLEEPDPGEGDGEGLVPDEHGESRERGTALQLHLGHLGQPEAPAATWPQLTRMEFLTLKAKGLILT
jgi:hypothetical protein